MSFFDIMNSTLLYVCVACGIAFVLAFCFVTLIRSYKHGLKIGLTKEQLKTAITSSAIYSIVPSLSIVVGLISLSAALGVPWAWFRLSVVGAVTYELISAGMVATGAGYADMAALAAAPEGASLAGSIMLTMSIGIMAGCCCVLLFGKPLINGVAKMSGGSEWGTLIIGVLSMAIIEAFLPMQFMKGAVYSAVAITSLIIALIIKVIIKKTGAKWLGNFTMAFCLILGMASSLFWVSVLG